MADIALYRKYRPQNFENLVGQTAIQRTLLNAIKSGHLSHAYLFCGPRGTGKTTTARLVAKAINCISPEPSGESCNQCEYCGLMNQGRLVDLIEIDGASNRGIDEIRDLREKIKFSPSQAPHKIYIIDEVHMLTPPAFNALLKTLEEPPKHAYFILATTEAHKIPDTILSRCQRFDFHRMEDTTLVERLRHIARQEQVEAEEEALALIARASDGGMRDAISLFEQLTSDGKLTLQNTQSVLGISGPEGVTALYQFLDEKDVKGALNHLQTLHREGTDLVQFNRDFLQLLREKMLDSVGKKEALVRHLRWVDHFQEASKAFKQSVIPQLPLEMAVLQCLTEPDESSNRSGGTWLSGLIGGGRRDEVAPSMTVTPPETPAPTREAPAEVGLKPVPEEAPKTERKIVELTLANAQKQFPKLVALIKTPALRISFKTGRIRKVEDNKVEVEFQAKFHLDKVNSTLSKAEIDLAFATVFGVKTILSFHLAEATELVDNSLEILGGELVG